jgi:hypothetical protein
VARATNTAIAIAIAIAIALSLRLRLRHRRRFSVCCSILQTSHCDWVFGNRQDTLFRVCANQPFNLGFVLISLLF